MSTGYTAKVQSGELTDHREFIWNIAHMFGGFVGVDCDFTIDSDAEKYIEMSTYTRDKIKRLEVELSQYESLSDEKLQIVIDKKYEDELAYNETTRERYRTERNRYENMLWNVMGWNPPTDAHVNIKNAAIKQLEDSITWDCNEKHIKDPVKCNVKEYRRTMIEAISNDLSRAYKEYRDELKAHKWTVEWIMALQDSLK